MYICNRHCFSCCYPDCINDAPISREEQRIIDYWTTGYQRRIEMGLEKRLKQREYGKRYYQQDKEKYKRRSKEQWARIKAERAMKHE